MATTAALGVVVLCAGAGSASAANGTYSAPGINCIRFSAGGEAPMRMVRPGSCNIATDGSYSPDNAHLLALRRLRWVRYSHREADAVGFAIANHAPFDPVPIRMRVTRSSTGVTGYEFHHVVVTGSGIHVSTDLITGL